MDDFNGVRRIVPCTNLNIDDILNLESSCDPPDKLQIRFQATTEPQRSRRGAATQSQDLGQHQPTIRRGTRVNLEYWQLECPHPSADPS